MNRIAIIGNLTRDPEIRAIDQDRIVCNMTIAVNRANNKDKTDFFRVSAWGTLGANCAKYLRKGSKCAAWGEVSSYAYLGEDGTAKSVLELRADGVEFLTRAAQAEGEQ